MSFAYPLLITLILISLIISGTLALWGMRRKSARGMGWFVAVMASSFIFTFFYGLEILSTDLKSLIFFSKMQYIGALNTGVTWLFLVASYTGKKKWLNPRSIAIIYIVPSITFILVLTNELHELIWINPFLEKNPAFSLLSFTPGFWWWINMVYANLLFVIATVFLITALLHLNNVYRQQIIVLLIFSALIWLANGIYMTGKTPYGINPTSFAFAVGGILLAWGLFRYKIGEISPVAKELIVQEMQEGLIVLNTQNKIVDINPMTERILGKESAELLGMPIAEVFSEHPELERMCHDEVNSDQHYEIKFHTKTKGIRSFEIRVSAIRDKRNRITGRLMFWHDITARVEQEAFQHLLLSIIQKVSTAENYKSALHKALLLIAERTDCVFGEAWLLNEKGSLLKNANASYYTGKKIEELKKFDKFSQDFSFAPNMGLPGRVWVSKKVEWQRDTSILPLNVCPRVVYAQKANLRASMGIPVLDKGEVIAILVFYMDEIRNEDQYMIDLISAAITQLGTILAHKNAEEVMRIQSTALEASSNGIVITDIKGSISWVNPAFTKLTGYSAQEIMGKNPRVLKSGQHDSGFYKEIWEIISSGESWQGEIINKHKNGSFYTEEQTITPTLNKEGEITHFVAIKKDITHRKEAEKALVKEQKKANELLKNILPEVVIAEITEKGYVTPTLYKNASILFTDFRNFAKTAEKLSPQELINLISHYFSFFDVIIGKYNLEKLKTIGDGYMCAGGIPIQNITHAFDITHAALDLLSFVKIEKEKRQKFGLPYWDVRIGISTGPLIAGVVGQKKYAYDVWGEAVVTAARMEQFGEANKINISKATYEIIKNRFDCEYRGKVSAKRHKLDMYFVNGARDE